VVLQDPHGVRTIVNFETRQHFEDVQATSDISTVVAAGVSFEDAQGLTSAVTGRAYFYALLAQWLVEGAEPDRLQFCLRNGVYAASAIGQLDDFREAMGQLGTELMLMSSMM
jgi:hypothetical protein